MYCKIELNALAVMAIVLFLIIHCYDLHASPGRELLL